MNHNTSQKPLVAHLQQHFGFDTFRPQQKEIIQSILDGHDTLAVLPTGAGKSLCYQLPGLLLEGLTIVVSPLLSLMADQVQQLLKRGAAATSLSSNTSPRERQRIKQQLLSHQYTFLYLSPEMLQSQWIQQHAEALHVRLVVIDEAHCISEWGHHFRPEYLHIHTFLETFSQRPRVAAFTASATPATVSDIIHQLQYSRPALFRQSALRKNLSVQVVPVPNKTTQLLYLLRLLGKHDQQSCIVYGATRQVTETTAKLLRDQHICAKAYHGGLDSEQRKRIQDDFIHNNVQVICATNAFGMGVDKPDIRCVIHLAHPATVESYYQEVGRAGRDGQASSCYLLTLPTDPQLHLDMIQHSSPPFHILGMLTTENKTSPAKETLHIHTLYRELHAFHTIYELKAAVEWGEQLGFWEYNDKEKKLHLIQSNKQIRKTLEQRGRLYNLQVKRLRDIVSLCTKRVCRMRQFVLYFEDRSRHKEYKMFHCGMCDVCASSSVIPLPSKRERAVYLRLLKHITHTRSQYPTLKLYTLPRLLTLLAASHSKNIPGYGKGLHWLIAHDELKAESYPSKTAPSSQGQASSIAVLRSTSVQRVEHRSEQQLTFLEK